MEQNTHYIEALRKKYNEYVFDKDLDKPIVSVIIACYNVSQFIDKCLDSVIRQTLKEIEIICIDDGSKDDTLQILRQYEALDARIKVIAQENQKQGAARNRGLDIARGEFIAFLDADDWFDLDYLELLVNAANKYNVNIAAATATRDYKNKIKYHLRLKEEKVYKGASDIIAALENNLITHSKIYRFAPICDLRFEEQVFYEDAPYTIKAIYQSDSLVTVPDAHYHYFSNPKSTIKQKLGISNENDKISTNLQVIDFASEHNITMKDWLILKENHFLWAVKHFKEHRDYYFFGIKIFSKKVTYDFDRTILIFNTACFGDVLLCNSLIQNIKIALPNSKVIFVVDKNWYDVAKYQKGVDEVLIYDKKGEHRGLFGLIKFVRDYPFNKPYASLITYRNERNWFVAKLLGSRFVVQGIKTKENISMQARHTDMFKQFTNKNIKNLPIVYNTSANAKNWIENDYIVLCTTSKNTLKDMPVETARELIDMINEDGKYNIILTGVGEKASKYVSNLKDLHCDFIDMVNKTSLLELASLIKNSKGLISVDTGTMHLGYALGVPTAVVFYEKSMVKTWAPDKELYNVAIIDENQTAQNIYSSLKSINLETVGVK